MYNLYIPFCSLILNIFLIFLYVSKVSGLRKENSFYFGMIINTFLMTIFCIVAVFLLYLGDLNYHPIVKLANRLECFAIFNFFFNLYMYVVLITGNKKKYSISAYWIINVIVFTLMMTLPIELAVTNDLNYMVTIGMVVDLTTILGGVIIVSIFFVALKNRAKIKERIIPILLLLIFIVLVVIVRSVIPELICLEFLATFATLIMYHTIENPDIEMITNLNIAKTEAVRANVAKSNFLSSMSHEIRTPLNAIVGLSENISDSADLPLKIKEDADDILSASNTLLEIVGNIIDINKIESEKLELIEVAYNLKDEIDAVVKLNVFRLGDKDITINVNYAEDVPYTLLGDRTRIKQIINNLLSNSIKYTERGTINITVRCVNTNDISSLIISVQDTGRGIKAEDINKLFTKFERLDMDKNTTTEGTGLGLSITKHLLGMMGGTINVNSSFGEGSIFVIHFNQKIISMIEPLTDTQKIRTDEIFNTLGDASFAGKKVLVVDDNKLNIKVARRSLESLNMDLSECYNGQEMLDLLAAGNVYDLILLDIMMPVMSGETAMARLRQDSNFKTPVIALTADAVAGSKEKYLELGFDDYIAKPFTKDEIKSKLRRLIK